MTELTNVPTPGRWVQTDRSTGFIFGSFLWLLFAYMAPSIPWPGPATQALVLNGVQLPLIFCALIMALRVSRHPSGPPQYRKAWAIIAIGFGLYAIGESFWFWYGGILATSPFPSWADPFYLSAYPFLFWGLMRLPTSPATRLDRYKLAVDVTIVGLVGAMAVWHLIIYPMIGQAEQVTPLLMALTVSYPLGDLILLVAVFTSLFNRHDVITRRPLLVLALGMSVYVLADLSFAYMELMGDYDASGWPDRLWVTGLFLWGLSGYVQYRDLSRASATEHAKAAGPQPLPLVQYVPYVFVALGYLMVLMALYQIRAHTALITLLVINGVVVTLVVIRQILGMRENELLLSERALHLSEARFCSLVQNSSDAIAIIDRSGTITYLSPSVKRVLGYWFSDVVGRNLDEFVHPEDYPAFCLALKRITSRENALEEFYWRVRHHNGTWRQVECILHNAYHDPTIDGLVVNIRDVTDRRGLEQRIVQLAFHDPLTSLANRSLLMERITVALRQQQDTRYSLTVMLLDLDDFKTINDSLGHESGDLILNGLAERLLQVMPVSATVARLGNDEFAILLHDTDEARATGFAKRIIEHCAAPFDVPGMEVFVRASIGIATTGSTNADATTLLRNADVAMYVAKGKGKNGFAVFEPSMYDSVMQRIELQAEIRRAIDQQEFCLFYQPTVDLATGRIQGFEALIRWNHPTRGLLAPGAFIGLAEETGLILPIGRWVLREACRQSRLWHDLRGGESPLTISVNLSVRQISDPELLTEVAGALAESGLDPGQLMLEITESTLVKEPETIMHAVSELKRLGVRLAIDDFGAGYASINYLRWFPADVLKIDRSFICELQEQEKSPLLRGIVALAQATGLTTIAEGIEYQRQMEHLVDLQCGGGQGYYFSRPVEADQVRRLLRQDDAGEANGDKEQSEGFGPRIRK